VVAGDCLPNPAGRDVTRDPDRYLDLRLRPVAHGLPLARHRGPGAEASPQAIAAWNAQNAFDEPIIVQYWHYVDAVLHGNLGYSYKLNQSVVALFQERWARSLYLSGMALLLSLLVAVPLGIFQAVKRNSFGDQAITSVAFTAYAMPDFLL
jgi:peptide/nickel transport system permease protein